MTIKFNRKVITEHFAIAADSLDDTAPYTANGDSLIYFNQHRGWNNFSFVEKHNSQQLLVKPFEAAINDEETKNYGIKPFPVYIETVISTIINTEMFDNYVLQHKRSEALAKLTDEDMIVLGLNRSKQK